MTERLGAIYTYTDRQGRPLLRKIRREGHKVRHRKFVQQAAVYKNDRLYWKGERGCLEKYQPEWVERAMYNLETLMVALRAGEPVHFVEGERDADTGTSLFKLACTTNWQGASAFTRAQAKWFTWYGCRSRINILIDNDDAGHAAAHLRRTRLIKAGVPRKRIRLLRPEDPALNDLTDVALRGLGLSAYVRVSPGEVEERANAYAAHVTSGGKRGSSDWR